MTVTLCMYTTGSDVKTLHVYHRSGNLCLENFRPFAQVTTIRKKLSARTAQIAIATCSYTGVKILLFKCKCTKVLKHTIKCGKNSPIYGIFQVREYCKNLIIPPSLWGGRGRVCCCANNGFCTIIQYKQIETVVTVVYTGYGCVGLGLGQRRREGCSGVGGGIP